MYYLSLYTRYMTEKEKLDIRISITADWQEYKNRVTRLADQVEYVNKKPLLTIYGCKKYLNLLNER